MSWLQIGVVDGGFDQSFRQFNVQRKKIYAEFFSIRMWMLNTKHCEVKQLIYCYNDAIFTIGLLSEKDNF